MSRFARLTSSRVVRNTGWAIGGDVIGLACQLGVFVLVAQGLGEAGYGDFAGTVSLMLFISPIATFGAPYLLVTFVANRGEAIGRAGSRASVTALAGGVLVTAVMVALQPLILPQVSFRTFAALAAAEVIFNQQMQVSRFAFQSVERLSMTALVSVAFGVSRLLLAVTYFQTAGAPSVESWATLYLCGSAVGALVALCVTVGMTRATLAWVTPTWANVREGLGYSLSLSASFVKNDADKALLLRFNQREAAGNYAAAYRMIGVAALPVGALADATYARLFSTARNSYRSTYDLARAAAKAAAAWASPAGGALFFSAPLLPAIVGDDYSDSVAIVRWLSVVPLLLALQLFGANALSACDAHPTRVRIGTASAVLNIGLNIALIPHYSWRGCVAATLISEIISLILIWTALKKVTQTTSI